MIWWMYGAIVTDWFTWWVERQTTDKWYYYSGAAK